MGKLIRIMPNEHKSTRISCTIVHPNDIRRSIGRRNIDKVNLFIEEVINNGTLKILKGCKNLIQEFQSYVWDDKSKLSGIDKPKKQDDHALDALRYALFTHLFGKDGRRLSAQDIDGMHNQAMYGDQTNLPRFFQDDTFGMY